uniref:Uncharacterized protein LOC111101974 n=1 Tax=Crassostrea virginica TaxID=6565 RepID=A0A8B8AFS3_CRAVI|nr:uncharacterized protein LOC111101974 [Crassostrea virginica]
MTKFQRKHKDLIPLILTESNQWCKIRFDKKYIIFIDDFVGKYNLDYKAFDCWRKVFDLMTTRLKSVFIFFALRHCIWKVKKDALTEFTLFKVHTEHKYPTVDLSGSEFGMTSKEKLKMLRRFCECHGVAIYCGNKSVQEKIHKFSQTLHINFQTLKGIASIKLVKGFPYLCGLFFSRKESIQKGIKFFQVHSANEYEKEQIDLILCQEQYLHYAILVFFFLNDKQYTKEELLMSKTEITEIAMMIGDFNPKRVTKAALQGCCKDLQHTFISVSDDRLKLKNMVTYEAVLMSFRENFPDEFLNRVNKTVLFTYVRSNGYNAEEHEVIIRLDDDMTCDLAKTLLSVYGPNVAVAYTDAYKHPAFLDKKLVLAFLDIVKKDESFRAFLNSFVAGACYANKDILASETIRRFSTFYLFDPQTFDIVIDSDMIHTCMELHMPKLESPLPKDAL